MTLRDLSIWMGCLLVGLTAIFAFLMQAQMRHYGDLETLTNNTRNAQILSDTLEQTVGQMAGLANTELSAQSSDRSAANQALLMTRAMSSLDGSVAFMVRARQMRLTDRQVNLLESAYAEARAMIDFQRAALKKLHHPSLATNPARKSRLVSQAVADLALRQADVAHRIHIFRQDLASRYNQQTMTLEAKIETNTKTTVGTFIAIQAAFVSALVYFATSVLPGFERIRQALRITADEDFDTPVSGATRRDEVGDMARAVISLQNCGRVRTNALYKLAYFDQLTGLANRSVFRDRLTNHLQHLHDGGCLAVFMLDLDKFKEINDVYGHPAGDIVLKEAARRLSEVSGHRLQACRFGGDEFGVVGMLANDAEAIAIGEIVLRRIRKPVAVSRRTVVTCGCTIGLATTTEPVSPDRIISQADMALYSAKEAGRGQLKQFLAGMDAQIMERRELEEDLRRAGARGELSLAIQPQVCLRTRTTTGFEALMRWNHPTRGAVSPGLFIPIAEESRLILEIGRWSILEACRIASEWPTPLNISVNLSAAQFYDKGLVPFVERTLEETGIAPERVEIEVTETVLIDDRALAFRIMHELRTTGVGLALDDFGTGFSSLSYLREFPFDKIKIDQSFVAAMEEGGTARSIVRSIIGLGKALGMTVIAEGVETEYQSEMLKDDGCDQVQGYLYGKAMPAAEALKNLPEKRFSPTFEAFEADSREEAMATARERAARRGSAA